LIRTFGVGVAIGQYAVCAESKCDKTAKQQVTEERNEGRKKISDLQAEIEQLKGSQFQQVPLLIPNTWQTHALELFF
jgi:hypothetical protein